MWHTLSFTKGTGWLGGLETAAHDLSLAVVRMAPSTHLAHHIHFFFTVRDQIKLYHWQTSSFSRHKATDDVIKSLDEHIDLFVEVWMGKYGRPKITRTTATTTIRNLSETAAVKYVKEAIAYLQGPLSKSLSATDSDLANIRDEMLGDFHKLLYLFTLK